VDRLLVLGCSAPGPTLLTQLSGREPAATLTGLVLRPGVRQWRVFLSRTLELVRLPGRQVLRGVRGRGRP
jgi:hypothetical protein